MKGAVLSTVGRGTMSTTIRVLVVDDSAFIRKAISGMLDKSPEIQVIGRARNGEEAMKKVEELSPDVMTLDIDMPGMDGLQVLESVMQQHPLPVIVVSSLTENSAMETLRALELGAVDFISKQITGSLLEISKIEAFLLKKVKAAAYSKTKIHDFSSTSSKLQPKKVLSGLSRITVPHNHGQNRNGHKHSASPDSLIIIGSSTGGPKVIQELLAEFPSTLTSAVIVVQHMPKFFTKPFAERLDQLCSLDVHEAIDQELLAAGKVLVAPGSQHLHLETYGGRQVRVRVSKDPAHLPYRPSVDHAMTSAAKIYGSSLVGVVLTGMGNDGEVGMRAIKVAGGHTLVQNEETCLVYGMPKAVIDADCADAAIPISRMSSEIVHRIQQITA